MAFDGNAYGSNVDNFNERKLNAKVVDSFMNAPTMASRVMSMGSPMFGKTMDYTLDITSDSQGEFFVGMETLNANYVETTIPLSFAQTAFTQPKVTKMLDDFINVGDTATIDLNVYKYQKAGAEALQRFGSAVYADGSANRPNGFGIIVLDSGTIGGQSRSTYSQLNATNTASGGTLTLAKLATLDDATRAASLNGSITNLGATTKTVWSLYESLLQPAIRNDYQGLSSRKLGIRSMTATLGSDAQAGAGFRAIEHRGKPIIDDDFATSGALLYLNEQSYGWVGRTKVPEKYSKYIEKVNLGTSSAYKGVGQDSLDLPSEYNGWFYQKDMVLPNQAAQVGRFFVIGQMVTWEPRRNGKLTGITGV